MKNVAKVAIVDDQDKYLLLWRSGHPYFPGDPDLPGGTLEDDEEPLAAALREVLEEAGLVVDPSRIIAEYECDRYSARHTLYHLYVAKIGQRPRVTISWEHESYDWVSYDVFCAAAHDAADQYMHMVYDALGPPRAGADAPRLRPLPGVRTAR